MRYGRVQAGEVLWIPYGWYASVVARTTDSDNCNFMVQPCVTAAMTKECHEWPVVSEFLDSILTEKLASNSGLYTPWAGSAVEWLRTTAQEHTTTVASDSGSVGDVPAIADIAKPKEDNKKSAGSADEAKEPSLDVN